MIDLLGDAPPAVARHDAPPSPTSTARSTRSRPLVAAGYRPRPGRGARSVASWPTGCTMPALDVPEWRPGDAARGRRGRPGRGASATRRRPAASAPSASCAALADRRRRRAARLRPAGDGVPPLGVPEGAVVAAFERVDLVEADPMAEIVAGGVDPDRALADHAFARAPASARRTRSSRSARVRWSWRPDLASGRSRRIRRRAPVGRSALQLAGGRAGPRRRARPTSGSSVGALPGLARRRAVGGGPRHRRGRRPARAVPGPSARVRRADRASADPRAAAWPYRRRRGPGPEPATRVSSCAGPAGPPRRRRGDARAAARSRAEVAECRVDRARSTGVAARARARRCVAAAIDDARRLADRGWRAVAGDPPRAAGRPAGAADWAIGGDAVAERTEPFDALAAFDQRLSPAGRQRPSAARDRRDDVDASPPAPTGVARSAGCAVDEDVDVRPEPRPGLHEPVAQARDGRVERAEDRVDRSPATSCRRSAPGNRASSERGSRTVAMAGSVVDGRPPRPPRSRAGRSVISRQESPSSALCHSCPVSSRT